MKDGDKSKNRRFKRSMSAGIAEPRASQKLQRGGGLMECHLRNGSREAMKEALKIGGSRI
jgi:hypothetical protein